MAKKKFMFGLISLLWLAAGAWWYSKSECSSCNTMADQANTTVAAVSPPLFIQDSAWMVSNADNVRFVKSGATPVISLSVDKSLDSLVQYAGLHPGRILQITGYYNSNETYQGKFENLGLARAEAIKQKIMEKNVPAATIKTAGQLHPTLYFNNADTLVGGIDVNFSHDTVTAMPATPDLVFEPMVVYFDNAKNTVAFTAEQESLLLGASKYLKANPGKKLLISGYTDNAGNSAANLSLSERRARFVQEQLHKYGFPVGQTRIIGKGMAEPIADNTTTEGRAKNRRVTITLE